MIYGAKPLIPFRAEAGAETAPTVDFGGTAPAAPANDNAAQPAAPASKAANQ